MSTPNTTTAVVDTRSAHPDPDALRVLSSQQETEVMQAFDAWCGLWRAAAHAYGSRRTRLEAAADRLHTAQLAGPAARTQAWMLLQDTFAAWWELPQQVRDWLRTLPPGPGFPARVMHAVAALGYEDENHTDSVPTLA